MKVKHTAGKGNGVFAEKRYAKDTLILQNEILAIPSGEFRKIAKTFLDNYAFYMEGIYFIALGKASLLNHSSEPNLYFSFRKKTRQLECYALRTIKKDEELTIDYEWDDYPWENKKR